MTDTDEILACISDYLDIPVTELVPEKPLESLGVDSLDFVEIVFEIEEKFDIAIPGDMAELKQKVHCIGDVIRVTNELIEQKSTEST